MKPPGAWRGLAGLCILSQNWQATDVPPRVPGCHCHYPPGGLQPRRGPREQGKGEEERERGGGKGCEGGEARPDPVPVRFMHPTLGPPIDRPHHGPRLKMHEGRDVRGGAASLRWQLDLNFDLRPPNVACCFTFLFSLNHAKNVGYTWVRF